MDLEYGKRYLLRDGQITRPLLVSSWKYDVYPFWCASMNASWDLEGHCNEDSSLDIVSECKEDHADKNDSYKDRIDAAKKHIEEYLNSTSSLGFDVVELVNLLGFTVQNSGFYLKEKTYAVET